MASTSTQPVTVPESKTVETSAPRRVERPADRPFTIKVVGSIPQ